MNFPKTGLVIFVLALILPPYLRAAPAAPSPVCIIEGSVVNILKNDYGYTLSLDLYKVGAVPIDDPALDVSCADLYKLGKTDKVVEIGLEEFMKNNIKVGDTITSKVHYTGDERAHGAYLSEVKNLGVSTKNVAIEKPVIPSNYLLYAFPFIASCCVLAIMIVTHKRA